MAKCFPWKVPIPQQQKEYRLGGGQMESIAGLPCLLAFLYTVFHFPFKLSWNKKKKSKSVFIGTKMVLVTGYFHVQSSPSRHSAVWTCLANGYLPFVAKLLGSHSVNKPYAWLPCAMVFCRRLGAGHWGRSLLGVCGSNPGRLCCVEYWTCFPLPINQIPSNS